MQETKIAISHSVLLFQEQARNTETKTEETDIAKNNYTALASGAMYYNRSCLWRAGGVCYHDNSKLRASIFTKLGM